MSFFALIELICEDLLPCAAPLSMIYAHMLHLNEGGAWDRKSQVCLWRRFMSGIKYAYLSIIDQGFLYDHKGICLCYAFLYIVPDGEKIRRCHYQYLYPNVYTFHSLLELLVIQQVK